MAEPSGIGWGTDVYRAVFLPINSNGAIDVPEYPDTLPADGFGGYDFRGPKNLTLNLGAPRAVTNVSQGRVNDTIYLPSTDAKTAEFHLSYIDQELFAKLATTKTRIDIGEARIFPFGTDKQGLEIAGAFLISNLAFHDENGATVWHNYLLPRVRAIVNMPSMDENALDVTVNLSLGSATKHLWGQSVLEANDGATQIMGQDIVTNGRLNIYAWLADGTEDIFLLPTDKPALSNFATTFVLWDYNAGTQITAGITKAMTGVTFAAAPTAGKIIIAIYEY